MNEDNAGTKVISIRSDFASAGPAINVTTNDPLLFLTNNSERARITSGGNLGIGTTSPARKLSVVVSGTGNVATFESNAGPNIEFKGTESSGRIYLIGEGLVTAGNFSIYDSTGSAERLVVASSGNLLIGGTIDGGQKLQVSGTGYFSGNVGIGANAANRSLEIHNASTPAVVLRNTGQGTDQKSWEFSVSGNVLRGAIENDAFNTEKFWLEVTRSSSSLSFDSVKLNTGAGTTALTLDSSQNATFAGKITANGAGSTFKGTATNDSAAAGYVGEFVSSTVTAGSPTSLTSGTPASITSVSLTAGDWDVSGNIGFSPNGSTTITYVAGQANTTVATEEGGRFMQNYNGITSAVYPEQTIPSRRVSISTTTTV